VSIDIEIDGLTPDTLPDKSFTTAFTDQVPSDIAGRLQLETVGDLVYVHETVLPSLFVALNVTSSPSIAFGSENAGVESLVALSVADRPLSDSGKRSGATGAGGVVSTRTFRAGDDAETFPAGSVVVDEIAQSPSDIFGKSQLLTVGDVTYVHDTVVPSDFFAVMVTVSPFATVPPETDGVLSEVELSVDDDPVSDAGNRSGVAGVVGGVESILRGKLGPGPDTLPAGSATVASTVQSPSDIVGRSQLFTVAEAT
jgi:hypothetical protein